MTLAPDASAQRTNLKPGMKAYSPQQEIELGRRAAQQVEQKMPMCNDPLVDVYLTKIGHRLIEHLNFRGIDYPWEFHCVMDKTINGFAVPGGFVFIDRGAIEAADNEAQLAGVMAHELSQVPLRHGSNQALSYPGNWKSYNKKGALALIAAGGVLDSGNGQGVE